MEHLNAFIYCRHPPSGLLYDVVTRRYEIVQYDMDVADVYAI